MIEDVKGAGFVAKAFIALFSLIDKLLIPIMMMVASEAQKKEIAAKRELLTERMKRRISDDTAKIEADKKSDDQILNEFLGRPDDHGPGD